MPDQPPGNPAPRGRKPDREAPFRPMTEVARYAGHGLTLAAATALFAWLGRWVDTRLSTAPLFVILGAFLGFTAGMYHMLRELLPAGLRGTPDTRRGPDRSGGGTPGREEEPDGGPPP